MNSPIMRRRVRIAGIEVLLSVVVVLVSLMVAMLFVISSGVSPVAAAEAFLEGTFSTEFTVTATLNKTVPLIFVALGWIVAVRGGRIHVGFPGQLLLGCVFASAVALKLHLPLAIHLPLVLAAGALGGGLYAGLAAWLWVRRGTNEILSTLLLNLVAAEFIAWWVRGPLHDPSTPLPQTAPFPTSARWPIMLPGTNLHWDIVLAAATVAIVASALAYSRWGYRVRLVGANSSLARQSGVSPERNGVGVLVLSGCLAGLAGTSLVLSSTAPAMGEDPGAIYGFTGIAVALLARNSPIAVLPAALLFGALAQGGGAMEGTVGVSSSLVSLVQGTVILLVLLGTAATAILRRRYLSRGQAA